MYLMRAKNSTESNGCVKNSHLKKTKHTYWGHHATAALAK